MMILDHPGHGHGWSTDTYFIFLSLLMNLSTQSELVLTNRYSQNRETTFVPSCHFPPSLSVLCLRLISNGSG